MSPFTIFYCPQPRERFSSARSPTDDQAVIGRDHGSNPEPAGDEQVADIFDSSFT